jgi:hypothetical protein
MAIPSCLKGIHPTLHLEAGCVTSEKTNRKFMAKKKLEEDASILHNLDEKEFD